MSENDPTLPTLLPPFLNQSLSSVSKMIGKPTDICIDGGYIPLINFFYKYILQFFNKD